MPDDSDGEPLPGKGFFGWLGRQIGYVSKAVHHDPAGPKTVYRASNVEEKPLPNDPNVKLRRTTVDEIIISPPEGGSKEQSA